MATLKRSNIEAAKRVFLDRLTTDNQKLLQPADIDAGPGNPYLYAGVGDSGNFGAGFDCSGLAGVVGAIAVFGPEYFAGKGYQRLFSTETFPGPLPDFRQVSQADLVNNPHAIKVCIHHGGGGPNSHMNVEIDGWLMESNGDHGVCTRGHGAIEQSDDYWNDFWVNDGPITEDTNWRQPMGYPRGFDYAGGRIPGAALKAAGAAFVCRYLTDGGPGLPGKQLLGAEFTDLRANGIAVVFNWETTANRMLAGHDAGHADAQAALDYIHTLPGVPPTWAPVVYFSCDFDEAPNQDQPIFDYLDGATEVLGTEPGGRRRAGIYGGYWIVKRALDAGKAGYAWQTEAWSGTNRDARANLMQRNGLGFATVAGVQCDINEAHTDAFGQFPAGTPATPDPTPTPAPAVWPQNASDRQLLEYIAGQLGPWAQLGENAAGQPLTLVDAEANEENLLQQLLAELQKLNGAKTTRKTKASS